VEENRVKRILILAALAIALEGAVWAGPKLVLSEDNWDFGDVPSVGNVSHTFTLTNAGDAVLKILNVSSSCGCTSTRLENQELKPGGKTEITATFNNAAYPSGGHLVKQITITTDDSTETMKVLNIAATICPTEYVWGAVTPRAIEIPGSKGFWRDVFILNKTAVEQRVAVIEKAGLVKEVRVVAKKIPSGAKGRVRVKVEPPKDPFPPSSLTLGLGSPDGDRRVSIPVVLPAPPGANGGVQAPKVLN
jgi:Protein of unknown function (DUF1573)